MTSHTPVLVEEVISLLKPKPGDVCIDATLGHGGHAKAFLDAAPDTRVIGIDADEAALVQAREALASYGDRVEYRQGNFADFPSDTANAILFDLGIGSHQIADETRGFSFESDGPLAMKYGEAQHLPESFLPPINELTRALGHYPDASELIDRLSPVALAQMVRDYGEEKYAGVVGNVIAGGRPFATARKLAIAIEEALPKFYEKGRIHPATRTFQALRLAVNRELECVQQALPKAVSALVPNGVIAVISFHSLEDRIVKRFFKQEASGCICDPKGPICTCGHTPTLTIITKKPVVAGEEEKRLNPRSRSAKLRAALRLRSG